MSDTASTRLSWGLRVAWVIGALTCVTLMWLYPGDQAITLHLIWLALAFVYGFTVWRPVELGVMVALTGLVTEAILIQQAAAGDIGWVETTEVPIGALTVGVVAWHIRRRHLALQETRALAAYIDHRSRARQELIQRVSHELRTPITIARGYSEALREELTDPQQVEDAGILLEELDKLGHIAQRLITFMQLEGPYQREKATLDSAVERILRRWTPTHRRQWTVQASGAEVWINRDRFELALDCLLDNAVKFTAEGDAIGVRAWLDGPMWTVEVADTGVGISEQDAEALNAGLPATRTARSGTGLGLIMVRAIASGWGGSLRVESGPGPGTRVTLCFPLDQAEMTTLSSHVAARAGYDRETSI